MQRHTHHLTRMVRQHSLQAPQALKKGKVTYCTIAARHYNKKQSTPGLKTTQGTDLGISRECNGIC